MESGRVFRQLVNKDLRENKCPATEWLKANEYPVTEAEKIAAEKAIIEKHLFSTYKVIKEARKNLEALIDVKKEVSG